MKHATAFDPSDDAQGSDSPVPDQDETRHYVTRQDVTRQDGPTGRGANQAVELAARSIEEALQRMRAGPLKDLHSPTDQASPSSEASQSAPFDLSPVTRAIDTLAERMDQADARSAKAFVGITEALSTLARRLPEEQNRIAQARASEERLAAQIEAVAGRVAALEQPGESQRDLEDALRAATVDLEARQAATTDAVAQIEDALSRLSEQVNGLQGSDTPQIEAVRERIFELSEQMDAISTKSEKGLKARDLEDLEARFDKKATEVLDKAMDRALDRAMDRTLEEFTLRLEGAEDRSAEAVSGLEREIAALRTDVEALKGPPPPPDQKPAGQEKGPSDAKDTPAPDMTAQTVQAQIDGRIESIIDATKESLQAIHQDLRGLAGRVGALEATNTQPLAPAARVRQAPPAASPALDPAAQGIPALPVHEFDFTASPSASTSATPTAATSTSATPTAATPTAATSAPVPSGAASDPAPQDQNQDQDGTLIRAAREAAKANARSRADQLRGALASRGEAGADRAALKAPGPRMDRDSAFADVLAHAPTDAYADHDHDMGTGRWRWIAGVAIGALIAGLAAGAYYLSGEHNGTIPPRPTGDAVSYGLPSSDILGKGNLPVAEGGSFDTLPVDDRPTSSVAPVRSIADLTAASAVDPMQEDSARVNAPDALFNRAMRLLREQDDPDTARRAAGLLRRAADAGLTVADYRLGTLFEAGRGLPKDLASARAAYDRAARAGNRSAMHRLALLHSGGTGSDQDDTLAAYWFQQAAELGVTDAQFNLAVLYLRGQGIPMDQREAFRWFSIAAAQGDTEAAVHRDQLARTLGADATAIRLAAAQWAPRRMDPQANGLFQEERARDEMVQVQTLLKTLGYGFGSVDGLDGARTRDAIRAFQTDYGLPVTGAPSEALLTALRSVAAGRSQQTR